MKNKNMFETIIIANQKHEMQIHAVSSGSQQATHFVLPWPHFLVLTKIMVKH